MMKKQNFFQRIFSFSGEMEVGQFWSDFVIQVISGFCVLILLCIALSAAVPGDADQVIAIVDWVCPVVGAVWVFPIVPMTRRRLRDAGYGPKSYLWLLLPVVGWIIFIVRLCSKSAVSVK